MDLMKRTYNEKFKKKAVDLYLKRMKPESRA